MVLLKRAVLERADVVADLGEVALVNSSVLTIRSPPRGRSLMLAFRAAGFIAMSTSGASPGVRIS